MEVCTTTQCQATCQRTRCSSTGANHGQRQTNSKTNSMGVVYKYATNWFQYSLAATYDNNRYFQGMDNATARTRVRRLRFSGHCCRRVGEMAPRTFVWQPAHGRTSQIRSAFTCVDSPRKDMGQEPGELHMVMKDSDFWRRIIGVQHHPWPTVSLLCQTNRVTSLTRSYTDITYAMPQ